MAQEPATADVVRHTEVLWRTRGRVWDYAFILKPSFRTEVNWYRFNTEAFADLNPTREEQYRAGYLDGEEWCWVSAAFLDEHRKDGSGRPVAHYIVWFYPVIRRGKTKFSVPARWARQFVSALGPVLDAGFDLELEGNEPTSRNSQIDAAMTNALSAIPERVPVRGERVEVTISLPALQLHRAKSPSQCPTSSDELWTEEAGTLSIQKAILEGEAAALRFAGSSLTVVLDFPGSQVLGDRLAASFGGSPTDWFVQSRIRGIKSRVLGSVVRSNPRRGYDALFEVLCRRKEDLCLGGKEGQAEAKVAELIGAREDDYVVRNLVARLRGPVA